MDISSDDPAEFAAIIALAEGLAIGAAAFLAYKLGFKRGRESSRPAHLFITTRGKRLQSMQLKDNDQLPLGLEADDKFGNKTGGLDAAPAWALSDPTFGTLTAAADGMSANFTPNGKLGDVNVQVSAAASGVALAGSLPVTVIAGDAAALVITPGTPVPQA